MSKDVLNIEKLHQTVDMLGRMLGDIIRECEGESIFNQVELIRQLAKDARRNDTEAKESLINLLNALSDAEAYQVVKAFCQFLNLANLADDHFRYNDPIAAFTDYENQWQDFFNSLTLSASSQTDCLNEIKHLTIELVLTAHPTEVVRRTLLQKYSVLDDLLSQLSLFQGHLDQQKHIRRAIYECILQIWSSESFRASKPTPIDEVTYCMAVVEGALWDAVPAFCKAIERSVLNTFDARLPLDFCPVSFVSWMGGDRDGNPNVTAGVTEKTLAIHRWKLTELYVNDIQRLIQILSMYPATDSLKQAAGVDREVYRVILRQVRTKLENNYEKIDQYLKTGEGYLPDILSGLTQADLLKPLILCHESLVSVGLERIANSALLDTIKRITCFGVHLARLDVRQESSQHLECMKEIVSLEGKGDYSQWTEDERQAFLIDALVKETPLSHTQEALSEQSQEIINTFSLMAEVGEDFFGAYVISMTKATSDILAVEYLLKRQKFEGMLPVSPLFETLNDLEQAASIYGKYLQFCKVCKPSNMQYMAMIGYSDSAKDASVLAANWAIFQAQERLLALAKSSSVTLKLFHGRGGSLGRGGGPALAGLLSQPSGSLVAGLRVTIQGEMIRAKLGSSALTENTLFLYAKAVLTANLKPPPEPKPQWRSLMQDLADRSCRVFRYFVHDNADFIQYFYEATPVNELSQLPIGSRPARRSQSKAGIENLRAIPWIFSWSQNRLMLPAWLGAGEAMSELIDDGKKAEIENLVSEWPFFKARVSMLEMVYLKTDSQISRYYDQHLVSDELQSMGEGFREMLAKDINTILSIGQEAALMDDAPENQRSFSLRVPYVDPINFLQAELLRRQRLEANNPIVREALMLSIAGVAAGVRNTG
ncbi:MAG: phosphoenolpyruvate carboxylase [Cellvibrionales bacterium]|nr:phosphoenolpyruvate carboxylase [Cellvibrionales bacterium]